ncbi:hypothetical protein QAD02_016816 [Eretmocerus hayati]|uniref:Uncharacterized protein n=1 Tax=Eretmocerus hayati TaxID=131215 RepID=A0ACC2PCL1_9HYME|nr:hypothetical protein QAD02_016816 [Eretmocerus hayati]
MTMFGSLVQRLTSPVTSPAASRRSRFASPTSRLAPRKSRAAKHLLEKRRSKSRVRTSASSASIEITSIGLPQPLLQSNGNLANWQHAAFPPIRATKSLGRLDGIKEKHSKFSDTPISDIFSLIITKNPKLFMDTKFFE